MHNGLAPVHGDQPTFLVQNDKARYACTQSHIQESKARAAATRLYYSRFTL